MSRTYRKRKTGYDKDIYVWEDGDFYPYGFRRKSIGKDHPEYKRLSAQYHKDGSGNGVPHVYTNLNWERKHRSQTKAEIQRWKDNPEHEVMAPLFRRSIGWTYW